MVESSLGPYRLRAEIGAGGMGAVYRAEALDGAPVPVGTPVAVKVIHPHLVGDEGLVKRFLREARIGLGIRHRNVVRTLDVGSEKRGRVTVPWIALEYVEGQTLRALLEETGRAPEALVRHVGVEIAKALESIHAAGVVHRDLKPENVLLAGREVVKVTDLGIARPVVEATRFSETGAFVGSLRYAAPEQFGTAANSVDGRTDLHALGLILYEMATGTHPYAPAGDDVAAGLDRLRAGRRRRAAEVNPHVSPLLDEAIETLLATAPERRFATAAAAALALEQGEASTWWTERARRRVPAAPGSPRIPVEDATAFVGREVEIERLEAWFAKSKEGTGAAALVEGEFGVGKTRLVGGFFEGLRRRGEPVDLLYGRYESAGAATPSGAIARALRERLEGEGLATSLEALVPELATLVPSFVAVLKGEPPPTGTEPLSRDAAATFFVRTLQALAARRPVVLVVEDLQHAPDEGRSLFASLALGAAGHRLLVLGTSGPGLPERWVADLARGNAVERTTVRRMNTRDLQRLLEAALGSAMLAEEMLDPVAQATEGHPMVALEIVRDLVRRGELAAPGTSAAGTSLPRRPEIRVPPSVREFVAARLAALPSDARELLDAASCEGAQFDPLLVAEALGEAPLPVLRRLARIEREHGLVRSAGARYQFDCQQVRDAVHDALPEPLRRASHDALAEAIERRANGRPLAREDAASACSHRLLAGRADRAVGHLEAALDHLTRTDQSARAAEVARLALAAPGVLEGIPRVDVLNRMAVRLDRLGRAEEVTRAWQEALTLADASGDVSRRCRIRDVLGRHFLRIGRAAEGRPLLDEALALSAATDDLRLKARIVAGIAGVALDHGRFAEARAAAERHLAIATELGDDQETSNALGSLGHVATESGRYEEAMEFLERDLAIARRRGDRLGESGSLGNMANVCAALGRNEEACRLNEQDLAICRAVGHRRGEAVALGNLAGALLDLGRPAEARERFERYWALARETGFLQAGAIARVNLGPLEASLGNFEKAREHLDAAIATVREIGDVRVEGYGLHGLGETSRLAGDLPGAERSWREAVALRRRIDYRRGLADSLAELGGCLVDLGRMDEARRVVDEAEGLARTLGLPTATVLASVARARLPGGDPAAAAETYRALAPRVSYRSRMEAAHVLSGLAVVDADALRTSARGLLDAYVAGAPAESRARMRTDVALFRAILSTPNPA